MPSQITAVNGTDGRMKVSERKMLMKGSVHCRFIYHQLDGWPCVEKKHYFTFLVVKYGCDDRGGER